MWYPYMYTASFDNIMLYTMQLFWGQSGNFFQEGCDSYYGVDISIVTLWLLDAMTVFL